MPRERDYHQGIAPGLPDSELSPLELEHRRVLRGEIPPRPGEMIKGGKIVRETEVMAEIVEIDKKNSIRKRVDAENVLKKGGFLPPVSLMNKAAKVIEEAMESDKYMGQDRVSGEEIWVPDTSNRLAAALFVAERYWPKRKPVDTEEDEEESKPTSIDITPEKVEETLAESPGLMAALERVKARQSKPKALTDNE